MRRQIVTTARLVSVAAATIGAVIAAAAADLTLRWQPVHDDVTAGYEVLVRSAEGRQLQLVDAKDKTELTLQNLPDNERLSFSIRPYDRWGNRAPNFSQPFHSFATPRVDALEGEQRGDRLTTLTLHGANFAEGARAVARRQGLRVASFTVLRPDTAITQIESATPVVAADLLIVNPVRRDDSFLAAHQELLDVDGSGSIDAADLDLVTAAFGRSAIDAALDLNGDGVIDAEDAAPLRAFLARRAAALAGENQEGKAP